ncbi:sigma intracellular receptor 2 [Sarcophilus harrisii]|uniref:sigma intracellular receptor 2 n=1 Tax=Sarcophilus harrisii TaxID=9305 RepID=UPI001301F107|nr:sigma intracellular receptor 2 [Sarcophilus harrisii]
MAPRAIQRGRHDWREALGAEPGAGRGRGRGVPAASARRSNTLASLVSRCAWLFRSSSGIPAGIQGTMGARGGARALEYLLGLYFVMHVPITLLFDMQALVSADLYPTELTDMLKWYVQAFKDPLMLKPPSWFKSFLFCELVFQLPFFPFAAYAFFKGSCKWIRIPAIIYSVHTMTTLIPIGAHILFENFAQGPGTFQERLNLLSIYAPYFFIPLILLFFMLWSPHYSTEEKRKRKTR